MIRRRLKIMWNDKQLWSLIRLRRKSRSEDSLDQTEGGNPNKHDRVTGLMFFEAG
jgi:hypothetical protein